MSNSNLQAHRVPVIVVGAGPVGLVTALKLAQHGIRCKLVERNVNASKWPKMDFMNCRCMELLRRMNISDEVRKIGKLTNARESGFPQIRLTKPTIF